jgi:hypothetical protein
MLAWDYNACTVDISMPGYVAKCLARFQHQPPKRPQHAPHAWIPPSYGAKTQAPTPQDTSPLLDQAGITRIQQIVGVLLFYARAVHSTMLPALGTIAAGLHTTANERTTSHLLDYAATHPEATIRFHTSDMVLHVHSDASYLSEPKSRSRHGGYFFLSPQ